MSGPKITFWQPIKTAPKDDRHPVLTYSSDGGFYTGTCRYTVAYWVHDGWFDWPSLEYRIEPTHWMELPEPPNE